MNETITLEKLVNVETLQKIQDLFAKSTNVASIITDVNGVPITKPSNFCRLCKDIIRKTEVGRENCYYSDSIIGKTSDKPIIQKCLSGGLWDSGASVVVDGKHIANWLIGQVRNENIDDEEVISYADVIGANKEEFRKAYSEVPKMSQKHFETISDFLYIMASQLSKFAYQTYAKERIINQEKSVIETLEKANKEVVKLNEAKDNFFIAAGHELRTPLNSIIGFANVIKRKVNRINRKEIEKFATLIEKNGVRLLNLIENILNYSNLHNFEENINLVEIDTAEFFEDIINSLRMELDWNYNRINLDLNVKKIKTDYLILKHIFLNIVSNANKFSYREKIHIKSYYENDLAVFEVIDSGTGIEDDNIENIFEPFLQETNSFNREFEGIGLGLALTKELVTILNGEFFIESKKNHGTKVTIKFNF